MPPLTVPREQRAAQELERRAGEARIERLTQQIAEWPSWRLMTVVEIVQAMRGAAFIVAMTVVAKVGDFNRVDSPGQLIAYRMGRDCD
ncbi:hypothetical protein ACTTAI_00465 (plasmid) [Rhodobacter capsulatus]|uniref:hypothetical protein n=1 Tax=Rhodobacter capsulatus TaxID=1061 RepID=UPI00402976BF